MHCATKLLLRRGYRGRKTPLGSWRGRSPRGRREGDENFRILKYVVAHAPQTHATGSAPSACAYSHFAFMLCVLCTARAWADPMREVGHATLRLLVHRVDDMRKKALEIGAPQDSIKPINTNPSTGMLSFRKFGFGTNRNNNKKGK